jgi:FAD binding domain
LVKE